MALAQRRQAYSWFHQMTKLGNDAFAMASGAKCSAPYHVRSEPINGSTNNWSLARNNFECILPTPARDTFPCNAVHFRTLSGGADCFIHGANLPAQLLAQLRLHRQDAWTEGMCGSLERSRFVICIRVIARSPRPLNNSTVRKPSFTWFFAAAGLRERPSSSSASLCTRPQPQ